MQNITVGRICLYSWHKPVYLFVCVWSALASPKKRSGRLKAVNCLSTTNMAVPQKYVRLVILTDKEKR